MASTELERMKLIGLALPGKTTNANGQSAIDCGKLWQEFERGSYASKIPRKRNDDVIAAYHQYEGNYQQPFSYFIGCAVSPDAATPEGMDTLHIPPGNYAKFLARGKIPDCIAETWKQIWAQEDTLNRAYQTDFEVYGSKSRDWNDGEVEIYISIAEPG